MKCDECQEQISRLADDVLGEQESGGVFLHLAECGRCRTFMRYLLLVKSSLQSGRELAPSAELDRRILSIPLRQREERRSWVQVLTAMWRQRIALPSPALAGLLLLLVLLGVSAAESLFHERGTSPEGTAREVHFMSVMPIEVKGYR